jgi:GMP synthase-like glutamine amidotransferase
MDICILEADRPAAAFRPTHGTYAGMFERWLGPALPEARFTSIYIAGGEPPPEDPSTFDGYLVTGARAGVYEEHAWIPPLAAFLRRVAEAKIPVAGVCFGHQIMAKAFGGEVRKSPKGWVVGRQEHDLDAEGVDLFGPGPLSALSFHQDQVMVPPPGARILLSNAASPHGGLMHGDFPALSVQFHPEFQPAYVHDLLVAASDIRVPRDLAEAAMASLKEPVDGDRVARGFAAFLRDHGPRGR